MAKTTFKLKNFQTFNEDFSETVYSQEKKEEPKVEKAPEEKPEVPDKMKPSYGPTKTEKKAEKKEAKAEEEEVSSSLKGTLENCIEKVEEIVRLFEKDDKKLIDLALPILDLCQTNLNFQEKKSHGASEILSTSKKVIKELVEKLKQSYPNNDPVTDLIESCNKL